MKLRISVVVCLGLLLIAGGTWFFHWSPSAQEEPPVGASSSERGSPRTHPSDHPERPDSAVVTSAFGERPGRVRARVVVDNEPETVAVLELLLSGSKGTSPRSTRGTADGVFVWTDVPPGNYTIAPVGEGWRGEGAAEVRVASGSDGEVLVRLLRIGQVGGTLVVDETDEVVPAIELFIARAARPAVSLGRTGLRGEFRAMVPLDVGAAVLQAASPLDGGGGEGRGRIDLAAVVIGSLEARELRVVWPHGGRIVGRVIDERRAPVIGATVTVGFQSQDPFAEPASWRGPRIKSDELGGFRFGFLPADQPLSIRAFSEGSGRAFAHGVMADARPEPLELMLERPALIHGTVRALGGAPAKGVSVLIVPTGDLPGGTTLTLRTDDAGKFRTMPLPRGTYGVRAFHWSGAGTEIESVVLSPGEARELALELPEGPSIRGTLVDASGEALHDGFSVEAWAIGGDSDSVARATPDGEGKFELGRLEAPRYRVRATKGLLMGPWQEVDVGSRDVRLVWREPEAALEVSVVDDGTKLPVEASEVVLLGEFMAQRMLSDGAGKAKFSAPPGNYHVWVAKRGLGAAGQPLVLVSLEKPTAVDISLRSLGIERVLVVDQKGAPCKSRGVSLVAGGRFVMSSTLAMTDASGHATLPRAQTSGFTLGLVRGPIVISAVAPDPSGLTRLLLSDR